MDEALLSSVKRKKRRRRAAAVILLALAALCLVLVLRTGGTGAGKAGGKAGAGASSSAGAVTLEIRCDQALTSSRIQGNPALAKALPKDGVLLPRTVYRFRQGETVYDALAGLCQKKGIRLESSQGGKASRYVEGIGGLYEFDGGRRSGWLYHVNGKEPREGASSRALRDGDRILWFYTLDYTKEAGGGGT